MTIGATTGAIQWTPTGEKSVPQAVTVRGVNAGGTTDLTFGFYTLFTSAVTGVKVTGTSLAEPTAHWVATTGEGSDLVSSYQVHGFAEWGVSRLNAKGKAVDQQRISLGSDDLLVIRGGAGEEPVDVATDLALMGLIDVEGGSDI